MSRMSTKQSQLNTDDEEIGQGNTRAMPSTGAPSIEPRVIEPAKVINKEKLDEMAFNEEIVRVVIHDSTNQMDDPIPEVWVNGVCQRFIRGREMDVKRKYIGALARAKITVYSQEKYLDHMGVEAYKNVPHTALKYPFSIVVDSNPKGKEWLKGVLAQAA